MAESNTLIEHIDAGFKAAGKAYKQLATGSSGSVELTEAVAAGGSVQLPDGVSVSDRLSVAWQGILLEPGTDYVPGENSITLNFNAAQGDRFLFRG